MTVVAKPELTLEHVRKASACPQLHVAADAMYRALNNLPCTCAFNVPYAGSATDRVVIAWCARCRSMKAYEEAVRLEVAK